MTQAGFVLGQTSQSPDSYELKTSIPPSPNAASLGKYGDIPVSYHTGIPNISIPIYEIKDGDVSLPVSLSYHASGIRVSEVASWVGLGWALNAGGVITRSIQHGPDEGPLPGKVNNPEGIWDNTPRFYTGYYRDGYTLPPGYEHAEAFNDGNATVSLSTQNAMLDAAAGNSDTEPDIFFFNVGSYSGKFFFKVDVDTVEHTVTRTPLFIPRSDVKVEVQFGDTSVPNYPSGAATRQTFIGFTLTAPDGFKYYFGGPNAIEYTGSQVFNLQNHNQLVAVTLAPSSWYLTRIESPTGRHIDLEYTNDSFGYYDLAPERSWGGDQYLTLTDQMVSRNIVNGLKLSRIYSSTEEIQFKAETVREDLSDYDNSGGGEETSNVTSKRLDRIELKQSDGSLFKKFLFTYDYFRSPDDSKFPKFIEDIPALKASFTTDRNRLRLESLSETSGDGSITIPPHQFTYINTDVLGQAASLPRRLSYQQDHWGYFNHEGANSGLISFWINPRKNHRQTNYQYTQIGTLNSIKYPTGGTTTFTYESHESTWMAEDVDNNDPGRIYGADSFGVSGNGNFATASFATMGGVPDVNSACMTLGTDCNVIYDITLKFRAGSPTGGTYNLNYSNFNITPAIEIYRVGETTPVYRYDGYLGDCGTDINCSLYTGGQPGASFREITRIVSFDLPPGQYSAKTYRYEGTNPDNSAYLFTASVSMQIPRDRDPNYQAPASLGLRKVGGLRVKSITTTDGSGVNPDLQRVFSYPAEGGILFSIPKYYYRVEYLFTDLESSIRALNGETFAQIWSSNSVLPMRTTQGNHIGYAWVKEEQVGNGYKIYSYDVAEHSHAIINNPYFQGNTFSYQAEGRQYSYPVYPPPMDLERGNLLSETHYNNNDKVVMSTYTTYEPGDDIFLLRASKVDFLKAPVAGTVWYIGYTHYPIFTSTNRVATTTVNSNYDTNGENPTSVTTTYSYNGLGHLQATSVTRTLDDVEYVDNMIYPPDYGSLSTTTGGIQNLKDKNVINVPIEKYTVKRATGQTTGNVISGVLTQYRADTVLPDAVYSLKISQPLAEGTFAASNSVHDNFNPNALYEKRISYYSYDALGNIREVSKNNDVHLAYIWGYSGSRPIAEIRNATKDQVFHTSFEDETANISTDAKTGSKSYNASYTVMLPSSGTFRLTYWKKTGSNPWVLIDTSVSANTMIGGSGSLIDEVRLFPPGAQMTTYTYDISAGMTTMTDVNNLVTTYHYDALKRLQFVTDNKGNVVKTYTYHYKNQSGN